MCNVHTGSCRFLFFLPLISVGRFFPEVWATVTNFHLTNFETEKNTFLLKCQISKSKGTLPPPRRPFHWKLSLFTNVTMFHCLAHSAAQHWGGKLSLNENSSFPAILPVDQQSIPCLSPPSCSSAALTLGRKCLWNTFCVIEWFGILAVLRCRLQIKSLTSGHAWLGKNDFSLLCWEEIICTSQTAVTTNHSFVILKVSLSGPDLTDARP